jgi:uncharacterized protein YukE
MSDRVLSSSTGRQAIQKMQQIINGPLEQQITDLRREGQTLSDPSVWDGMLAQQFRGEWPDILRGLQNAQQLLEDLRTKISRINDDIMRAGGNM